MNDLQKIFLESGTDKGPSQHNYGLFYDRHLAKFRTQPGLLLEIGVQGGGSLRGWGRYLPEFRVVGVDIDKACLAQADDRHEVLIADQSNKQQLESLAKKLGPFDIIVDDGSHIYEHQILTLKTLLRHLKPGGVYILEDLQTSYWCGWGGPVTAVDFLKRMVDALNGGGEGGYADVANEPRDENRFGEVCLACLGIHFYRFTCVIERRDDIPSPMGWA